MPAAPVTTPADPVAATRRKLARLLAVGAMRAAAGQERQPATSTDVHESGDRSAGADSLSSRHEAPQGTR
jgi:hypothetical protein